MASECASSSASPEDTTDSDEAQDLAEVRAPVLFLLEQSYHPDGRRCSDDQGPNRTASTRRRVSMPGVHTKPRMHNEVGDINNLRQCLEMLTGSRGTANKGVKDKVLEHLVQVSEENVDDVPSEKSGRESRFRLLKWASLNGDTPKRSSSIPMRYLSEGDRSSPEVLPASQADLILEKPLRLNREGRKSASPNLVKQNSAVDSVVVEEQFQQLKQLNSKHYLRRNSLQNVQQNVRQTVQQSKQLMAQLNSQPNVQRILKHNGELNLQQIAHQNCANQNLLIRNLQESDLQQAKTNIIASTQQVPISISSVQKVQHSQQQNQQIEQNQQQIQLTQQQSQLSLQQVQSNPQIVKPNQQQIQQSQIQVQTNQQKIQQSLQQVQQSLQQIQQNQQHVPPNHLQIQQNQQQIQPSQQSLQLQFQHIQQQILPIQQQGTQNQQLIQPSQQQIQQSQMQIQKIQQQAQSNQQQVLQSNLKVQQNQQQVQQSQQHIQPSQQPVLQNQQQVQPNQQPIQQNQQQVLQNQQHIQLSQQQVPQNQQQVQPRQQQILQSKLQVKDNQQQVSLNQQQNPLIQQNQQLFQPSKPQIQLNELQVQPTQHQQNQQQVLYQNPLPVQPNQHQSQPSQLQVTQSQRQIHESQQPVQHGTSDKNQPRLQKHSVSQQLTPAMNCSNHESLAVENFSPYFAQPQTLGNFLQPIIHLQKPNHLQQYQQQQANFQNLYFSNSYKPIKMGNMQYHSGVNLNQLQNPYSLYDALNPEVSTSLISLLHREEHKKEFYFLLTRQLDELRKLRELHEIQSAQIPITDQFVQQLLDLKYKQSQNIISNLKHIRPELRIATTKACDSNSIVNPLNIAHKDDAKPNDFNANLGHATSNRPASNVDLLNSNSLRSWSVQSVEPTRRSQSEALTSAGCSERLSDVISSTNLCTVTSSRNNVFSPNSSSVTSPINSVSSTNSSTVASISSSVSSTSSFLTNYNLSSSNIGLYSTNQMPINSSLNKFPYPQNYGRTIGQVFSLPNMHGHQTIDVNNNRLRNMYNFYPGNYIDPAYMSTELTSPLYVDFANKQSVPIFKNEQEQRSQQNNEFHSNQNYYNSFPSNGLIDDRSNNQNSFYRPAYYSHNSCNNLNNFKRKASDANGVNYFPYKTEKFLVSEEGNPVVGRVDRVEDFQSLQQQVHLLQIKLQQLVDSKSQSANFQN